MLLMNPEAGFKASSVDLKDSSASVEGFMLLEPVSSFERFFEKGMASSMASA